VAQGLLALGLLAMGGLEVAKIFGNFSGALMALPSLLLTACWLKIIREDGKDLLHTYRAKD
jgi:BCCT family betaine/carnitine transporter